MRHVVTSNAHYYPTNQIVPTKRKQYLIRTHYLKHSQLLEIQQKSNKVVSASHLRGGTNPPPLPLSPQTHAQILSCTTPSRSIGFESPTPNVQRQSGYMLPFIGVIYATEEKVPSRFRLSQTRSSTPPQSPVHEDYSVRANNKSPICSVRASNR